LLKIQSSGGALVFSGGRAPRAAKLVSRVLAALDKDPNVLLIGPPGTGKTVVLEELREHYERTEPEVFFDPELWDGAWTEMLPASGDAKVVSLVFHPSYTYENFVAGLVPKGGGELELVAKPGSLVSLAHWAGDSDRAALLLADEFNRGAAAAIFGDTLGLLDGDKRDRPSSPGAWIERPFPDDVMNVSEEFAAHDGTREVAKRLTLPWNLRIVAAMNSTDRSVAPIDAALRRRFAIINVGPDYEALAERLGIALGQEPFAVPDEWTPEDVRRLALHLLISLNGRVLEVLGQDFLLGHALLWHVGGADLETVTSSLVHAFDERIVATLRLTFADQDEALAAVLGIPQGSEDQARLGYWRTPEGAMAAVATPRFVINDLSSWSEMDRQLRALSSIVSG
jgi:5-methylcytosine-specific restriction protein B